MAIHVGVNGVPTDALTKLNSWCYKEGAIL